MKIYETAYNELLNLLNAILRPQNFLLPALYPLLSFLPSLLPTLVLFQRSPVVFKNPTALSLYFSVPQPVKFSS